MFAFGVFVQRFLLRKIIPGGELNTLLYTAGLSLLIANLALLFWTGDYRNINLAYGSPPMRPFGISVSVPLAIAFVLAIAITTALYFFLSRTDTGRAVRATAQNPESAALMGVNVARIDMITFGLGTALAGAAGALLAPSLYLYPTVGEILVVKCFVVVVLGGLGSIPERSLAASFLASSSRLALSMFRWPTRTPLASCSFSSYCCSGRRACSARGGREQELTSSGSLSR